MLAVQAFRPLVVDPMAFATQLLVQLRAAPRRMRLGQIKQTRFGFRRLVDTPSTAPVLRRTRLVDCTTRTTLAHL